MKFFFLKHARNPVHHTQRYSLYAACAVLLVLVTALVVTWIVKDRAQANVELGRQNLAASIQTDLYGAVRDYEKLTLPAADLSGDILPSMHIHLYAARVTNRLMLDTYGQAVVEEQTLDGIDAAIQQIEHMLELGQSTSAAESALGTLLEQMEADLSTRFADSELLLSRTALK